MNRSGPRTYSALAIGIATIIFYVELYPFKFRFPVGGPGGLHKLLQTWADAPVPGDFLRNVVAYMLLAFCATRALGDSRARLRRISVVVAGGAICCISFELAQYFIPGRYTSAMDVYADTLGLLIGSAGAVLLREQ